MTRKIKVPVCPIFGDTPTDEFAIYSTVAPYPAFILRLHGTTVTSPPLYDHDLASARVHVLRASGTA
jgi:hypothetical protein